MIKPIDSPVFNAPVLSSAKPRCGFQKVADLVPRLIRQYEIQARITRAREEEAAAKDAAMQDAAHRSEKPKRHLFEDEDGPWLSEPVAMPAQLPPICSKVIRRLPSSNRSAGRKVVYFGVGKLSLDCCTVDSNFFASVRNRNSPLASTTFSKICFA